MVFEDVSHAPNKRQQRGAYIAPIPVQFNPGLIGDVVTIQVIPRKQHVSDELVTSLMTKYVGRLAMYVQKEGEETFVLEGTNGAPVVVNLNMAIVEVYRYGAKGV